MDRCGLSGLFANWLREASGVETAKNTKHAKAADGKQVRSAFAGDEPTAFARPDAIDGDEICQTDVRRGSHIDLHRRSSAGFPALEPCDGRVRFAEGSD
jgi:hypothetical protein